MWKLWARREVAFLPTPFCRGAARPACSRQAGVQSPGLKYSKLSGVLALQVPGERGGRQHS